MKRILGLCAVWTIAASAHCAQVASSETNVLRFFLVSESPVAGGRKIDTAELPKVGYIGSQPDMDVLSLQSVASDSAHIISRYAGKTTEGNEPAITITMFPPDAKRLADLTEQHVGKKLLLMLGETPLTAPIIQMPIETPSLQLTLGKHKDADRIRDDLKKLVRHE